MMRALNTSGTGMVAQQYNLDVISNNLANVNTTAFKSQRAEFEDLMYQTIKASGVGTSSAPAAPIPTQIGLGVQFSATASNFGTGPLQATNNPMDVAINGTGFFKVLRPDGVAYTRDGSFKSDANGLITTSDGYSLDPPVTLPKGSTSVNINPDGSISAVIPDSSGNSNTTKIDPGIQTTTFVNPAGLQRIGQNLFRYTEAAGETLTGKPGDNASGSLQPGFLEGSNVQVVDEMVKMISAQRAYEINSKAIQTSDEMLQVVSNLKK